MALGFVLDVFRIFLGLVYGVFRNVSRYVFFS